MRKIILNITLGGLFCLLSCNEDKTATMVDIFPSKVHLKNEICIIDSCIAPTNIIIHDNNLFYKEKGQDFLLRRLNLSNGSSTSFLSKGNGPGEVNNVIRLTILDNVLQVFTDPEKVLLYPMENIDKKHILPQKELNLAMGQSAFASAFQVLPNVLFYSGKISETDTCRYCVYDAKNDSLFSFEGFPADDFNINDFPSYDMSKQLAYQGDFVISPQKNRISFFFFYGLGFDIIDVDNWKVIYQNIYQYPDVKLNHISALNINKIVRNPDSYCGFIDACATDKYVYALYTGKSFKEDYSSGKHVLQYSWNGEPMTHYILNAEVNSIAVNEDNDVLYATTNEEEARIIKYNMKSKSKLNCMKIQQRLKSTNG